ncbi:hypothetical protein HNY73_002269 [Argiope bruennichi]|uniref:SHSP domain-containing protein n=1 Tax=Argiope bruennichi TaxID=94029 RepID=A0A8T0FUC0_ARGBR|nr:hypothetical protein HNY73_002269 [Argiope bruennichi]
MAYEFDEIQFLKIEGRDWWQSIKRIPLKLLDQDFGKEVQFGELEELLTESTASDEGSSSSSEKIYDIDNLKLKEDVIKESGYSKVKFGDEFFEAEIFSRQFDKNDFNARIEKGFLIIGGCQKEKVEGDGMLWRHFERRYMLPHDCHITDVKRQLKVQHIEGGISVRVHKTPVATPGRKDKHR